MYSGLLSKHYLDIHLWNTPNTSWYNA